MLLFLSAVSGVPQCSFLDPLLFLKYVTDLPDIIYIPGQIKMFTGDTKFNVYYGHANHDDDKSLITESLFLFVAWPARRQLSVASQKGMSISLFPALHSSINNVFVNSYL